MLNSNQILNNSYYLKRAGVQETTYLRFKILFKDSMEIFFSFKHCVVTSAAPFVKAAVVTFGREIAASALEHPRAHARSLSSYWPINFKVQGLRSVSIANFFRITAVLPELLSKNRLFTLYFDLLKPKHKVSVDPHGRVFFTWDIKTTIFKKMPQVGIPEIEKASLATLKSVYKGLRTVLS